MNSESLSIQLRHARHPATDAAQSALVAATAFAALVLRYTREDAIAIEVSSNDDAAPIVVRVAATPDTTLGAIEGQVRPQLGRARWVWTKARLSWAGEGTLSIVVRLADLRVDAAASREQGMFAGGDGLSAVARHFHAIERAFRARQSTKLRDVALLSEAERRHMLEHVCVAEAAPELAGPTLLHALFEERARATPRKAAVRCNGRSLTYAALDARAERLAAGLRARGIGAGAFVALRLARSIDVYVAMLGVLKAGAAYVPIDPETPVERVDHILADCGAALLLTHSSFDDVSRARPTVRLDEDWERALPVGDTARVRAATPDDVAYVIYTSGSTGKPKGVAVEHRSVAHLVQAEQRLFRVTPSDRVLQGFSIAFDAAVEEIWLAFAAGATLVVATKETMLGDLARHMSSERVTVFSTVPTLLASIEVELPTVRLLIVGGEACPQALVDRWATRDREMFNTYGPTEATVIATYARLSRGAAVTIGRPLPNVAVYVVDRAGHLAPMGMAGELVIGGVGVARGYVGAPELTASRFVPAAYARGGTVYKTGDLGRFDRAGNVEFLGRVDDQVKLRGYRIELGEIESALLAHADVSLAAATVREDAPGAREIVAYVVARPGRVPTAEGLKQALGASLPAYMIPAHVEIVATVPTLTSGKVDKRSLPPPRRARSGVIEGRAPRGALEETIARSWQALFGVEVARDSNFFLDLGGHSMLAARVVSELRRQPELAALSVLDVYEHPTVAGLAAAYARAEKWGPSCTPKLAVSRAGYRACCAAQAVGLYGIFATYSFHWLAPYLTYVALRQGEAGVVGALVASALILLAVQPLLLLVALAAKWLVIGRYRPGRHALWGAYYLRFWIVDRLLAIAPTTYLVGTPLLAFYYRLLGARIGENVHIASDDVRCFDLVSIGDDATIGIDASIASYAIEDGVLVIGKVSIGDRCVVGPRAVVARDTAMHEDASLGELSLLPPHAAIPAREHWSGSPARVSGAVRCTPIARPNARERARMTALYATAAALLPGFVVTALFPGLALLNVLEARIGAWSLAAAPIAAASFVVLLCLEIALVKRVAVGRARAGRFDVWSATAFRRWLLDRAMAVSLDVVGGLYATLFLAPWYRLLGVRLGKNAEVSTASSLVPDLVEIGDEAFVADCVSLGTPRIARGLLHLEDTRIGKRAFIGNSAVVAAGTSIAADCLVGCLSAAPDDPKSATTPGTSWVGSPPIALPTRQASASFSASETYRPTRALVAQRLAIEALRVTLPTTCFVVLTCLLIDAAIALHARLSLGAFVGVFPLLYAAFGVGAALLVVATKRVVIGRHRPGERPLWSTFVWRNELVTAMHENLADPFFNELLCGTPFAAWFFRALGAKIGRRVYIGTTQLTEYDLVRVGDDACLNADCTLQTHLFEDRVMKMSTVTVGDGCTVGAQSVVLYDTTMEAGSRLGPLSLLMKGESLPPRSGWVGTPARRST